MSLRHTSVLVLGLSLAACSESTDEPTPDDGSIRYPAMGSLVGPEGEHAFRFGAASAATQIEDQNPNTDWYLFTQPVADGGYGKGKAFVGDASRGYTKAIDDIQLMKDLGLDSYRFSIEWARIEPKRDQIDEAALEHYSDFIDALLAAGIRPNITLHHFSNPQWLDNMADPDCVNGPNDDNLCGLGHPQGGPLVVEEMGQFAQLLAQRFGDRVDDWATLNEPVNYLLASYGLGSFPPGKQKLFQLLTEFIPVVRDYIRGHGAMYDAIKSHDTIDSDADGRPANVGLTLSVGDWVPAKANEVSEDADAIEARDRLVYVYHYLVGDTLLNGSFDSDLDGMPDEQHPELEGKLDWLGVQYYFRAGVAPNGPIPVLELAPCFSTFDFGACVPAVDPSYCVPQMKYEYYPPGLFTVLEAFGRRYPGLPLVVSEAGIATSLGVRRAENVVRTLEQIEKARQVGVDVRGYYHWSLFDNFEWSEGFEPRFGLYTVDYQSYARTPTQGADVFGEIARARLLTPAQRESYGGDGPMTVDPEFDSSATYCNGR